MSGRQHSTSDGQNQEEPSRDDELLWQMQDQKKTQIMTGKGNGEKKGNLIVSHELMTLVFWNRKPLPAIINYSFIKDSAKYSLIYKSNKKNSQGASVSY
jgi:hypothetical protein